MRARSYLTLSLVYTCLHLAHIALSCVLLLNGWTPLSVRERAELADISALGLAISTYKEERTMDDTYTAAFRLLALYKGHELLSNVTKAIAPDNVYNISNFGSKVKCYADVDAGSRYILFLTLFEGQLSAQYDDLFGAAAIFTETEAEEISNYLGWDTWTQWSACGATCAGGKQIRSRDCPRDNGTACIGMDTEIRSCNLFSCGDSHDLLTLMGVRNLPAGVSTNSTLDSAFVITKEARLFSWVSQIYPVTLPTTFSILMKFKVESPRQKGYFFTVSDVHGKQQLAVFLGRKFKFQYLGNNYGFQLDVLSGRWQTVGLSVSQMAVALHADCEVVMKRRLRSKEEYLGNDLVMSIGPYFSQYGKAFEGEVEQLMISSDHTAAGQLCGPSIFSPSSSDIEDTIRKVTAPHTYTTMTYKPIVFGSDWSPWSACSATCGQGWQSRALYCRVNIVSDQSCLPVSPLPIQTRLCYLGDCKASVECHPPCENGGTCLPGNICKCKPGYSGDNCQNKECTPACQHGGVCTSDGVCQCAERYAGSYCQTPVCHPPCQNGGQCVYPDLCACQDGFYGSACERSCSFQCLNGGECVGVNSCQCRKYFTGVDCSIPLCKRGCYNGGRCVAPNHCACPVGYYGKHCQKVHCRPPCQNDGVCISPDVCLCKTGFYGSRCQKVKCDNSCLNGGTCVPPSKCECPPFFFGKQCQRERCKIICVNGGRCQKNQCQCPAGFTGRTCERSTCTYQQYLIPYRRTYRKVIHENFQIPCETWSFQTCFTTRLKYVLVTKDTYRTAYRCV